MSEMEQNKSNSQNRVSNGVIEPEQTTSNESTPAAMNAADPRRMPVIEQLGIALGVLVLVFGAALVPNALKKISPTPETPIKEVAMPSGTSVQSKPSDTFETISLEAQAVFVWDVKEQRVLYSKNPDEELPLASIAKLMTALVAYELLGNSATVGVGASAIAQEGDSGLRIGEQFKSQSLLDLTLLNSSNDGAFALAAAAGKSIFTDEGDAVTFVEAMNVRAEELGFTQSSFKNPTGLDVSASMPGAVGSARDVAFLMEYLLTHYPETLEYTQKTVTHIGNTQGELHDAENTNLIAGRIAGLIGSKTGYTTLAGGNLVIAFDAGLNHPVVVTVLGSSWDGRFTDVEKLVRASRAEIINVIDVQ